jgi:flagellar M-ring protein FliF
MLGGFDISGILRWASALGPRRLGLLAIIGLSTLAAVGAVGFIASRPNQELLYSNVAALDMARITQALAEAGFSFDVGSDGTRVYVRRGDASRARAMLAERGLPASPTAGYELFDKLGPLGLTTFMQEVTRVRALEGELSRTIQSMRGIKSARVHIVFPDRGSFRRPNSSPSASVVIKTEQQRDAASVPAIRQLVAAAVPGLTAGSVRVLSADGSVFSQEDDESVAAPVRIMDLERRIRQNYQDAIRRTLAPHIGIENFEASVAVRINADRRQVNETRYDPTTRVERSVRAVRETGNSQNATAKQNVGVEQNIAQDKGSTPNGEQSQKSNVRRDEVTNYEIGSTQTATISEGYKIERLTVATVVNRKQIAAMLGGSASEEAIAKRLSELEQLIGAAVGLDTSRGDHVTVAALDFADIAASGEPAESSFFMNLVANNIGTVVNSLLAAGVVAFLVMFGLRPAVRALERSPAPAIASIAGATTSAAVAGGSTVVGGDIGATQGMVPSQFAAAAQALPGPNGVPLHAQLEQLIASDTEKAAAVLRRWVREGVAS